MPRTKTLITEKEIIEYRNAYNVEHYITLRANSPKSERLGEQIDLAVSKGAARSRQAFILEAIRERLNQFGITIDMLDSNE